jgi:hypothetical protein
MGKIGFLGGSDSLRVRRVLQEAIDYFELHQTSGLVST